MASYAAPAHLPSLAEAPLRIDTHTHILPRDWPSFQETFGYAGFIRLEHHTEGWARMMKNDPPPAAGGATHSLAFPSGG